MNSNVSELATLVGVSVAVNATYAIQNGKNAVVTIVAGGFLFVSLVLIGGLTGRQDIARALGAVFLLSSALFHGIPLVESVTQLVSNAHATNAPAANGTTATGAVGPLGRPVFTPSFGAPIQHLTLNA